MSFEPKKFNDVFEAMRQRTSVVTDFEVGSVARTMYESFAYEIALLYEQMQLVYLSAYVDTAQGQQLDRVVAILGIKRGLPDFAEGVVTFQRDVGQEDILIPINTLVATEDKPESPKKVYQTIEDTVLRKDQPTIEVKVQAVNRGEEEVTSANTLVVMPRPIPGIKSVTNPASTLFTGKRRETDEELRQRAKNTLISSGKATILAIENALLSLPSVKDVKVKENFQFAQGTVTLTRGAVPGDITIPQGTRLIAAEANSPTPKVFKTTTLAVLETAASSVDVTIQAAKPGKEGELVSPPEDVTWQIEEEIPLDTLTASHTDFLLVGRGDYGIIEVFVDGVDFDDAIALQRLRDEIDRVRAAGIFVLLQSTVTVRVDGVFKVEINPDLKLSQEERIKLEQAIQGEIVKYIEERRMGQPLLFAQLIKNVLSLENISNLEDFQITTEKQPKTGPIQRKLFDATDKRIEIEDVEKFASRHVCVASETKPLPVSIQFRATGLDDSRRSAIAAALDSYFKGLKIGNSVPSSAIIAAISSVAGITLDGNSLKLIPKPWCQTAPPVEGEVTEVVTSFVEQPVLGEVFAYSQVLQITGALRLTLPTTATDQEKQQVREQIRLQIISYLEALAPEADVVFADLIAIAANVSPVLVVNLEPNDFQVALDDTEAIGRVSDEKIEVQAFEKTQLQHFCITSNIELVQIVVTALELDLIVTETPPESVINTIKQAVANAVNNFLVGATPGQNLIYNNLKNAVQNLVTGANYEVKQLSLTATSSCDNRVQSTSISTARNIHTRSVEIASLQPIATEGITVNVITISADS